MRKLPAFLLVAWAFAPASVLAQTPPQPLSLRLGGTTNDRSGDPVRTLFQQTQGAINAMVAARGAKNGLAALDSSGLVPAQQLPTLDAVTGSAAGVKAFRFSDASDLLVPAAGGSPLSTILGNGALPRINTDALVSLSEADPPVNQYVGHLGVQSSWKGRQSIFRTAPAGPRTGYAYIGENITLLDPGSQINGPANAGYAQNINVIKQGYPSLSSKNGELDGLLITGRQSGPTPTTLAGASDLNGIQMNVQQAGDPGFSALFEGISSRITPDYPYGITHGIRIQFGVIDPFGKNGEEGKATYAGVNRLTIGYAAISDAGQNDRAFYAVDNGTPWGTYFFGGYPTAPSIRIMGNGGDIVWGPDNSSWTIHRDGGGSLKFLSAGNTLQGAINADGTTFWNVVTTNGVNLSGVQMLTGRNTLILPPLPGPPANPANGETYNDGGLKKLRTWDGTAWNNLF